MKRRSTRSARLRLTLQYAGTFLLLGTVVIAITYLLTSSGGTITVAQPTPSAATTAPALVSPHPSSTVVTPSARGSTRDQSVARGAIAELIVDHQHSADARRLLGVSWLVLVVTTVAAAGLGWFVAGRVLRPLRSMTDTARTISAGNLGDRLALQGPEDEFKQLGDTFDELLGRLETSFEAQRRFVANASHELRTPLTVDRTLLQVALADPDATAGTLRATCEELLASGREHERLIDALLTLASSEAGLSRRDPVDLAAIAGAIASAAAGEAERSGVTIATDLGPATANGDPALIERLVANLLDNAVRYNEHGGSVQIRTVTERGAAVLVVANTGQRVPSGEVESLFEPFRRLHGSRLADDEGHHGLGLSIVRSIAASHRAELVAVARPEGGLEVTVRFPVTGAH